MHAVLHLSSMSFFIPDHQTILLSASIFVEPRCPKFSASTTCLFSSSGTTILSAANSKRNRLLISLKTKKNSSGALSFRLFLTHIISCNNSGSNEVLWIEVFRSSMKWKSVFFSNYLRLWCSSFSVFQSHSWVEYNVPSFGRNHFPWGPRCEKWTDREFANSFSSCAWNCLGFVFNLHQCIRNFLFRVGTRFLVC